MRRPQGSLLVGPKLTAPNGAIAGTFPRLSLTGRQSPATAVRQSRSTPPWRKLEPCGLTPIRTGLPDLFCPIAGNVRVRCTPGTYHHPILPKAGDRFLPSNSALRDSWSPQVRDHRRFYRYLQQHPRGVHAGKTKSRGSSFLRLPCRQLRVRHEQFHPKHSGRRPTNILVCFVMLLPGRGYRAKGLDRLSIRAPGVAERLHAWNP